MMQEHPFFSGMQMYYGKHSGDEEEMTMDSWSITLGEMQTSSHESIGLFILWIDSISADEIHFS